MKKSVGSKIQHASQAMSAHRVAVTLSAAVLVTGGGAMAAQSTVSQAGMHRSESVGNNQPEVTTSFSQTVQSIGGSFDAAAAQASDASSRDQGTTSVHISTNSPHTDVHVNGTPINTTTPTTTTVPNQGDESGVVSIDISSHASSDDTKTSRTTSRMSVKSSSRTTIKQQSTGGL